jgi:hypothetical protein
MHTYSPEFAKIDGEEKDISGRKALLGLVWSKVQWSGMAQTPG